VVVHDGGGVVNEPAARATCGGAQAELRLLAAGRAAGVPPEVGPKTAVRVEELAPVHGAAAEHVAHGGDLVGQARVAAADRPEQLRREPGRLTGVPAGQRTTPDAQRVGVGQRLHETLEPVLVGLGVVVEESDERRAHGRQAEVASRRQAPGGVSRQQRARVGEMPLGQRRKVTIAVDDHHDLVDRDGLALDRLHGRAKPVPALSQMTADDDAHRSQTGRSPLDGRLGFGPPRDPRSGGGNDRCLRSRLGRRLGRRRSCLVLGRVRHGEGLGIVRWGLLEASTAARARRASLQTRRVARRAR